MKFAIITHVVHKEQNNKYFAYEPYIREINLWSNYVDEIILVAPKSKQPPPPIEVAYKHSNIDFNEVLSFDVTSIKNSLKSFFIIPKILWKIFSVMKKADHIHLRCPGNIGLLGCFVQMFFPKKPKTVKYAGNWDPNSKQPFTYKLQKWIVSNTFLTKNCKVLVYGEWENQTKNIVPFFTASYKNNEIIKIQKKNLLRVIKFIFVGNFSKGKQPLLSVKVIKNLLVKGYNVQLNMFGNGVKYDEVNNYIKKNKLEDTIFLHGNKKKEIVKKAYQDSHFLIFISKSEGWPKVVAEAMFWKCLPISSKVSCVADMLGNGERGTIVDSNIKENQLVKIIIDYLKDEEKYQKQVLNAQMWSQKYTLNTFETEIKKILLGE